MGYELVFCFSLFFIEFTVAWAVFNGEKSEKSTLGAGKALSVSGGQWLVLGEEDKGSAEGRRSLQKSGGRSGDKKLEDQMPEEQGAPGSDKLGTGSDKTSASLPPIFHRASAVTLCLLQTQRGAWP